MSGTAKIVRLHRYRVDGIESFRGPLVGIRLYSSNKKSDAESPHTEFALDPDLAIQNSDWKSALRCRRLYETTSAPPPLTSAFEMDMTNLSQLPFA